jgi:hypothetical protein
MSNLATFKSANLPSVKSLATALRSLEKDVSAVGTAILKMDRTGHWVFGADQTETESDSLWAVNPFSFVHGYIAWGDGEVLGEKMVSVAEPLPELTESPPGAKKGWEMQVGLSLKCMSGEDKGLEARFSTTSVGGKRSVQELAVAIATQVDADQSKPVAVIKLSKSHYAHKSYGKIYTPVFDVQEWVSMSADADDAENVELALDVPDAVESEQDAPVRRRRAAT